MCIALNHLGQPLKHPVQCMVTYKDFPHNLNQLVRYIFEIQVNDIYYNTTVYSLKFRSPNYSMNYMTVMLNDINNTPISKLVHVVG